MSAHNVSALAAVLAVGFAACNGGLPTPIDAQPAVPVNASPGIGFFLGVEPSGPITEYSLTGAAIPNVAGSHHAVMLVAFTTPSDAADADGEFSTTDPIDLTVDSNGMPTPPLDNNGSEDVFLAAIVSSTGDLSGAFNLRLFDVTQHPRCITCHGQNYPGPCDPGSSHTDHNLLSENPCAQAACTGCHTQAVTGFNVDLDGQPWRSPPFCDQPSCTNFDFRNRTPASLCTSIANRFGGDPSAVFEHLTEDPFIIWAITSAQVPFTPPGPAAGGPVPIDFETDWSLAVAQWVAGFGVDPDDEFNCVSLGSRRDVVLVSRNQSVAVAGDAASRRPSITYVPNPGFQVGNPTLAAAGTVFVAYDSDASNLTADNDTNGTSDVFRSSIEVWVDADFVAGDPTAGSVDLRFVTNATRRVSLRDQSVTQGTGSATHASIGASGDRIAFVSTDSNIVDPNSNGLYDDDDNGAPDVFVRQISNNRTQLLSTDATGLAVGNGASSAPAMSPSSDRGVAFQSSANDLVPNDTNAVEDVFYVLLGGTSVAESRIVRRASLASGGYQAAGGACANPSIHVIDADGGDVLVGFQSAKTTLASTLPPNSTVQAFLHESATLRTTLLNQKLLPLPTMGSALGGASPADSGRVRFSVDGSYAYFESLADNIDVVRPIDDNLARDVFRVDLGPLLGSGRVRPERISLTRDGQTADAMSSSHVVAGFRRPGTAQDGGPAYEGASILFESLASNLPTSSSNRAVLVFAP